MELKLFQVDAFSVTTLGGNPAAVCPLDEWLPDEKLQAIAAENNVAETAYFVRTGDSYHLRWFTPEVEVDLCGHATLAASWVLFNELSVEAEALHFNTRGGELRVSRRGSSLAMDFPATVPRRCEPPPELLAALGIKTAEVLEARDYIVVVKSEAEVASISPNFASLKDVTTFGVSVTAKGKDFDFISRWFGPRIGVNEDITTGAAHTWLAPYWAERLGKQVLTAEQGGKRKGQLTCEVLGDRVLLIGAASTYLKGIIEV
ncbi:phenazine biosynthesis, PhzF family protein [Collimonas fungivorans]|uniref:Phenazine biosynthesis, PhzF family protein n=1 Tax=Collimonas fungivorans TaxID=158899 RepID=A0A127P5Z9_9BURK|nr:PhzF family phenazine biosynthesis protein [Collimonas fungivorans]AMO93262.1 phenazine biosynthesis, PhzF family protein [Collimonas fungivorans]